MANESELKRVSIVITKELHKKLKMEAIDSERSMKDFIMALIYEKFGEV